MVPATTVALTVALSVLVYRVATRNTGVFARVLVAPFSVHVSLEAARMVRILLPTTSTCDAILASAGGLLAILVVLLLSAHIVRWCFAQTIPR